MQKNDLSSVKGKYWIFGDGNYIVLLGKKLWIFKQNGSLIACKPEICNAYKVAFLPCNRLLVGGGRKTAYQLLSLDDGSTIWSIDPIKKMEVSSDRFALSPDNMLAYDYFTWKNSYYIAKIDLQHRKVAWYPAKEALRATHDILCDETGTPCLLQTHYEESQPDHRISKNGVVYQYSNEPSKHNLPYWKYEWQHDGITIAHCFLGDTEHILTKDLYVFEPRTGVLYYLLENDPEWVSPGIGPSCCWLDQSGQYIMLMYNTVNIVIDWKARKMVARYQGDFARGYLAGNQYWIATTDGIRCVSFPIIEDIPPNKNVFW